MTLYLHAFQPDLERLMRLAARERLLPPGDDPGYAVHAVLAATFGEHAPAPWALLEPGQGGGPAGRLLAYGTTPPDVLRDHAAAFADPAFAAVLDLPNAPEPKCMPARFAPGTRLGFRVRLRPVSRLGRPLDGHPSAAARGARGCERDVYAARRAAVERRAVSAGAVPAESAPHPASAATAAAAVPTRAECYLDWLDARLRGVGAELARDVVDTARGSEAAWAARVDAFRFTRLLTRDRSAPRARSAAVDGPDATVTGTLIVTNSDDFAVGLARGLGRHRAFGFGMLLLTPPRG